MSEKSPMADITGHFSEAESGGSYASIHITTLSRQKLYSDRFLKYVVNYAVEWEKVVNTRVSDSLKKAEMLRRDLDHYQAKVESLRKNVNVKMAKGKLVDPKESEKLKRNEDKLMTSRKEYEEYASDLCALIEEVTERSWKDCHPLLIKLTQFDATLSTEEAKVFSGLNAVTEQLKQIGKKHGLKPEARLKDIEASSAQMVSTKDKERALQYEQSGALTAGDSWDGGLVSPTSGESAGSGAGPLSPPSTWAGDSVEGLPQNPPGRAASFSSVGSSASRPMGTTDMLTLAAASAPAPTLDQLNDATGGLTISDSQHSYGRHAQSTGALPPLPPSGGGRNLSRSGSLQPEFDTSGFGRSVSDGSLTGPVAPAPATPPPLPPAALSMYPAPADTAMTASGPTGYNNYQAQAPPPVQTGALTAHPWSNTSGSQDLSSHSPAAPHPFGASPTADVNPFGGGAQPMNQYGGPNVAAPSPPASYGAPMGDMGLAGGSTHSSSTNPFE
mmetsp:Transcript_32300/g.59401  ORF Transcript_32300/g.59401 Transcript_32300/m.59401 type:complete len:500 (-) Transcript_32300:235-1734(-)